MEWASPGAARVKEAVKAMPDPSFNLMQGSCWASGVPPERREFPAKNPLGYGKKAQEWRNLRNGEVEAQVVLRPLFPKV